MRCFFVDFVFSSTEARGAMVKKYLSILLCCAMVM